MVQINGSYKLVENRNFYEFLIGAGLPEEEAKKSNEIKGTLTVQVDGNEISMENDNPKSATKLIVGKEVDETLGPNKVIKSTTAVSGDVITIVSKRRDGTPAGTRTYKFSESGLELTISASREGKSIEATRIFKRV